MHKFGRTVLTFVIVGPPVGLAMLWGLPMLVGDRPFLPGHVGAWLAMLVLAYVIGVLPALFAGIGVAVLEKPGFWRVSRVGLIVGLVPTVFFALTQWPKLPSANVNDILDLFVWPVSICLIPTVVCWLVVRSWVGSTPVSDMHPRLD
jgi:hypothetical protein